MKGQRNCRNENGIFITVSDAMLACNYSRKIVMKTAEESNSIIRVGRSVRINKQKWLDYLQVQYGN